MKEDVTFYYIVWVITFIVALFERRSEKPFNNVIVTYFFMVVALLVACRLDVGADWSNYRFIFYNGYDSTGLRSQGSLEPIFFLIRTFFYNLGFTHAVFFFFLSLVSLLAIHKSSELFEIKYFMTVFLVYYSMFFLNYQFNIVRHGVMASFVWLSFAYRSKGEMKAAIVSIIVALGFHITALIFVPFLFLLDRRYSRPMVYLIILGSLLAYFLHISKVVIGFFPFLFEMERTATFFTNAKFVEDYGLTLGSLIQVFLFLFLYFRYGDSYDNNSGFRILLNSLLFSFMLLCFLNAFYAIISRICNTLFMSMIFLLPLFLEKLNIPRVRLLAESFIIIYLVFSFPKTFAVQEDGLSAMLPYKFKITQLVDKSVK